LNCGKKILILKKNKNRFEKVKAHEFTSKRGNGIRTMLPNKPSQNSY
jgi:hypothetical protein